MVITIKSGGKGTPKTGKLDAYANVETGEIITTSFIRQMKVDDDQFAKLYVRKVSMLFDISKTGTRTAVVLTIQRLESRFEFSPIYFVGQLVKWV